MMRKLLGAALVTAAIAGFGPVQAAKMHSAGCSAANLEKTETAIEAMADGDARYTAQKEIAAAQDALLSGKMGVCSMHLSRAMHAGMTN